MSTIDDVNYLRDERTRGAARPPVLYTTEPDGSITETPLPTRWAVCPVCEGKGTHVNPSIDCGGLTREDFEEDPDFAESYARGDYDQTCNRCNGRTTVQAVDLERLTTAQRIAYERQLNEEANNFEAHLAEVRAGA